MSTDIVQKEGHIATLTLDQRSALNALTYDVVLTGAGRGFCSGANLMAGTGEALGAGGMGVRAAVMAMNEVLAGIAEMQKRGQQSSFRDTLHWEVMMLSLIAQAECAAEYLMAFSQKREPEFKGR